MICPLLDKNLLVSAKSSGDASHAEIALLKAESAIMASDYSQSLIELSYLLEASAVASCLSRRADNSSMLARFLRFRWNQAAGQIGPALAHQYQGDDQNEHKALLYLRAARWLNRHVSPRTALTPELILDFHSRCISGRGHHQSGITYRGTRTVMAGRPAAGAGGQQTAGAYGQQTAAGADTQQTAGAYGQQAATRDDGQQLEPGSIEDIYPQLIELCSFMNRNLYSPVIQAIVARLAFEAAVPFDEPTNATLKLLFHTTLRRQGVTRRLIAPVSLLECHYPSLFESRYSWHSDVCHPIADQRAVAVYPQLNTGVSLAAGAVEMAANALSCLRETVEDLEKSWLLRVGHVSKSSLLEEVLALLPAHPLLTVDSICQLTNRRFTSVNDVVTRLVRVGILKVSPLPQTKTRLLTAPDVFSAYEMMLTAIPSRFCLNEAFRMHLLN